MQQKPDSLAQPIAIIGMGCRFPGGIDSPEALWTFLSEAGDAIGDIPPDRWDLEEFFDPTPGKEGKMYTRRGGFLSDVRGFDPSFFGISPREARTMDPQQRLLLETAWEAFEDGGIPPKKVRGSSTGVFVGLFVHDYENIHSQPSERRLFCSHSATGTSATIASNRISHCLDLRGPSLTVDTACSSSLVAVHLACQSLLSGESDLALAGGANTILRPEMSMLLCQAGMLSPSGLCHSFDSRADGYVRAEGAGMLVLKRLEDAERDGDHIRAVLRATAVNQDGGAQGMTVPSADSQEQVIKAALDAANLSPYQIGFVEAHGTGTPVGDPIECKAIGDTYGSASKRKNRCPIGSIKSNIGHTESAAGVAGLMKLVLMLERGRYLPNRHFSTPNPDIDFDGLNLVVSCSSSEWESSEPRIGAVNSFGFGGTNAHAIVQEYRGPERPTVISDRRGGLVLPISARSRDALQDSASRLAGFLSESGASLSDVVHTLAYHREHHAYRYACVADTVEQAYEELKGVEARNIAPHTTGKIAFIYSGMGQQWPAMGKELFESEPVFRKVIEQCDHALGKLTSEWKLIEELLAPKSSSRLNRSDIAQPCLFAVQAGLTALWESVGVRPDMVLGHSAGEVSSFHAAGVMDLEDALRVSYIRGLFQQQCSGKGGMLAVGLPKDEITSYLEDLEGSVSIAAENSPSSITLSGNLESLKRIAEELEAKQVFARFVPVDIPYHSSEMDCLLRDISLLLKELKSECPSLDLVSSVTGEIVEGVDSDASYWCRNVREPVAFRAGFETLLRNGADLFVEISAHPVLSPSMKENLLFEGKSDPVVASLRRNERDGLVFRRAIAELYGSGVDIDWKAVNGPGQFLRLPTYPFQNEEYWEESDASKATRMGTSVAALGVVMGERDHPVLGQRLDGPELVWRGNLEITRLPYLAGHKVDDAIVFPGAAGIEMMLSAVRRGRSEVAVISLTNLKIENPIVLEVEKEVPLETRLRSQEVSVDSCSSSGQWSRNYSASFGSSEPPLVKSIDLAALRDRLPDLLGKESVYRRFSEIGLEYGEPFQGVQWLRLGSGEALGEVHCHAVEGKRSSSDYVIHPADLDACFQVAAILPEEGTYLPVGADRVTVFGEPKETLMVWAKLTKITPRLLTADIQVSDNDGNVIVSVDGLVCHRSDRDESRYSEIENLIHSSEWIEIASEEGWRSTVAPSLPSPGELKSKLSGWIAKDSERLQRVRYYEEVGPDLDRLSAEYILSAIAKLGGDLSLGSEFTSGDACDALGIAEQHRKLFDRLLAILREDGYLEASSEGIWRVVYEPNPVAPDETWTRMFFSHSAYEAELLLLARCGERLEEILKGNLDPLEILFPQDSQVAEQLYRDSPTFVGCKRIAREVVCRFVEALPKGRTLRILEVGGGTGSLASHILPLLPEHCTEYHFTDISPSFAKKAEQRFHNYSFVKFGTFDLEKAADAQGLEDGSFDLVVAADVIHATTDVRRSAERLRKLLLPGGQLLITESTHPPRWFDLVFGTLAGWWLFQDFDLRASHPTMPFQKWKSLLNEVGFQEIEGLSDPVEAPLQTLILARIPSSKEVSEPLVSPGAISRPVVVFPDHGGFWKELSNFLPNATVLNEIPDRIDSKDILLLSDFDFRDEPSNSEELQVAVNQLTTQHLRTIQALAKMDWKEPPTLWWITSGAEFVSGDAEISLLQTTSRGMARVAASELAPMTVRHIDLGVSAKKEEIAALIEEIADPSNEREIVLRGSRRFVSRLIRKQPTVSGKVFRVAEREAGIQNSFPLVEANRVSPGKGEIEIEVCASGLNFKDIARFAGLVKKNETGGELLGLECAGTVLSCGSDVATLRPGDRVVGLVRGAFSSHVTGDARLFVRIPDPISFEEAATLPVAFLSAWYALVHLAGIKRGETVLIHSASGGFGLAAVQVARLRGARILATAGSLEKRLFLSRLGIEYVGDSRSLTFVEEVRDLLGGNRVDVILNTLPEEALEKSLSLLTPVRGRCIDLANLHAGGSLPLSSLKKGVQFSAFDLESILCYEQELVSDILENVMISIVAGKLKPIPFRSFSCGEAEQALAFMKSARHIGKVLLTFTDETRRVLPDEAVLNVGTRGGTCLISGGLGGFGLATARWIAECGIRQVVLLSRGGVTTESMKRSIANIENAGATVNIATGDVTDASRVREVLSEIADSGEPLRGVIHAAMVLEDVSLKEMSSEQMEKVIRPKVVGGWNLDHLTRDYDLDFFVSFSSFSSTVGTNDQGNYAAANAFLDSLALSQRLRGVKGCSVSWGSIGTVGYVSGNAEIANFFRRQGVYPVDLKHCWKVLRYVIEQDVWHISAAAIDWARFGKYNPDLAKNPRYSLLLKESRDEEFTLDSETDASLPHDPVERLRVLEALLSRVVGKLLGLKQSGLDLFVPLTELGFDSLMAGELALRVREATTVELPRMTLLASGLDVSTLAGIIDEKLESHSGTNEVALKVSNQLDLDSVVDELGEEDLDELLGEMLDSAN